VTGRLGNPARLWWLAGAVCVAVAMLLPFVWNHAGADLKVYRLGGSAILADPSTLYGARLRDISMPFTYPLFGGLVMVPVSLLPWPVAYAASIAASLVALVAIWRLSLRKLLGRTHPAVLVALVAGSLLLEPVRETLSYGQINLILCAIVLYDVLDQKHASRGVWIGIAAGIKLTPLVFLGLLLVTRQWRALLQATAAFAATVALGFLVAPRTALDYWTHLIADTGRIGGLAYSGNQSWNGFLIRLTGDLAGGGRAWQAMVGLTVIGGLWVTWLLWRRGEQLASVSACALIGLLCSPVSWSHHWVWILPLGISLLCVLRGRWRVIVGALWFGLFLAAPIWWPPRRNNLELKWTPLEQVAGNAYLWLALAGVALLVVASKSGEPVEPAGQVVAAGGGDLQHPGVGLELVDQAET
jgi:alpha-1,2-mannosyltransferase